MKFTRTLSVFAMFVLCTYPTAAEDSEENQTDTLPFPGENSGCKDRMCPRLYDPVCGTIDGVQMTAPSRCDLNNKIRCAKMLRSRRDLHGHIPMVRFLHHGPCEAEEDLSTVVRMRRDEDQDMSNEEDNSEEDPDAAMNNDEDNEENDDVSDDSDDMQD